MALHGILGNAQSLFVKSETAKSGQWRYDPIILYCHKERQFGHLTEVSIFANISSVKYTIEYFHARVKNDIESWPDGILVDYARLVDLLMEFGPNLRMPHSRPMGDGLFELRLRGREGMGRTLYCFVVGQRIVILHAFIKKTRETPENELRLARKRMKEVRNG